MRPLEKYKLDDGRIVTIKEVAEICSIAYSTARGRLASGCRDPKQILKKKKDTKLQANTTNKGNAEWQKLNDY
jgi:hypothetical protein